jgi:uncharacterized membrane protein YhaH (DUF805 family)
MRITVPRFLRYLFSFQGRAGRKRYWATLGWMIGSIFLIILFKDIIVRYVYPEIATDRGVRNVLYIVLLI